MRCSTSGRCAICRRLDASGIDEAMFMASILAQDGSLLDSLGRLDSLFTEAA